MYADESLSSSETSEVCLVWYTFVFNKCILCERHHNRSGVNKVNEGLG